MNVIASKLGEFEFFAGLDDQTRAKIASHVHERTFEPGEVVALAGEPCQVVCLVVRGIIRTRRLSMEGREYILEYVRSGQAVGLVPALDGGLNLATAEALTRTEAYLIPCEQFREIVRDHPSVAAAALSSLSARVRGLSDTVEDLALHTVRARLARFLLSQHGDGPQPSKHWTQEEIAIHIGTVRDVVGRTLRSFARQGYIRRERGRLVIADRTRLEREAMYV
jgi:CRP/FNR family cyclic AMP-dependent transcriptional regulator